MRKFLLATSSLFLFFLLFIPAASQAQVAIGISVHLGPPVLPVYTQPPCPMPGYIWTPGYWAWGEDGYYWVPGVWVSPPEAGLLWTPGYWGFVGGEYIWRPGYWGPHVGFYGGINYGFGYGGVGFVGGRWNGGTFVYNTAVTNVNTTIVHNTYVDKTVINNTTVVNNHYSFNGQGGVTARASAAELSAEREHHFEPTANQASHEQAARVDRGQLASVNHGKPGNAAMDSINGRRYNPQGHIASGNEINARRENQQDRIANGVRSGQMTPGEAARAEKTQQGINRQVAADRAANGGKLTPAEKRNINKEQNGASRQIYNEKHNEKTEPR